MIGYVYLAGLAVLLVAKLAIRAAIELAARVNAFSLRNAIARERGIEAYRAWLPLERIRPSHIPQQKWEQMFAWPADDKPPYPSLLYRVVRDVLSYVVLLLVIAALVQAFTPFPTLNWLESLATMLIPGH